MVSTLHGTLQSLITASGCISVCRMLHLNLVHPLRLVAVLAHNNELSIQIFLDRLMDIYSNSARRDQNEGFKRKQ